MLSARLPQQRWPVPAGRRRGLSIRCFAGGVAVDFQIPYHCRYGQHVCVVGNADKLGGWEVSRAVEMNWSDGDMWKVVVEFPAPSGPSESLELEYKYVVRNSDRTAASWTPGTNYKLAVPANGQAASGARVVVKDSWDGDKHQVKVLPDGAVIEERPAPVAAAPAVAEPAVAEPAAFAAAPKAAVVEPPPAAAAFAAPPPPAAAAPAAAPEQLQPPSPDAQAEPAAKKRGRRKTTKPATSAGDEGESAALAAITKESERAMEQLDDAITSSWELLEGTNDPADPELLAADRVLAAASQRAAAMNKALEAAAAQRLLGDGGKDGKPGRK